MVTQCITFLLTCFSIACIISCNAKDNVFNRRQIYQLGDSISDTGNLVLDKPIKAALTCTRWPYGSSYFHHPTGRCSNGLLIIDFIAKALDLPLLGPFLSEESFFTNGANFAFGGATALEPDSLSSKGIINPLANNSLSLQLDYLWSHFNGICYDDNDCLRKLKKSLFIVGEIGSNDYYYALSQGKGIKSVMDMVPEVVDAIAQGVRRVIQMNAPKVIVPGMFPLDQFPAFLSTYNAKTSASYTNYISSLNNLTLLHNNELQKAIKGIRKQYKNTTTVVYADYYAAFEWLLKNAPRLGFNATNDLRDVCCGYGRLHNFSPAKTCGARGVPVRSIPDGYIMWDGINLTQTAYRVLARWIVRHVISHLW